MRARYPDREGFVERDGVKLHYEVFGTGDRTIFFLPTWSIIHSRFWKAQVPYFARHFRVLTFDGRAVFGSAHWKVGAIDEYARGRPAAWVDDFLDEECERWAAERYEPTLLVRTESHIGLTDELVEGLIDWADSL